MLAMLSKSLRIAAAALLLLALAGAYWLGGHRQRQADEIDRLSQQNAAVAEALQIERRAASLGQVLAAGEQVRTTAREAQTKIVTREVVRYVEREKAQAAAGGAVVWLDAEWVRGHDLAAAVPAETGAEPVSDGGAGPATAGEALAAVTDNYTQCQRWRDQVIGWQEWWSADQSDGA